MKIAGMLRVKNEGRWIGRVINSIRPLCGDNIHVLDDHSTDATVAIARAHGAHVYLNRFTGINETRDKNWLLAKIMDTTSPDWVLHVDGDEELEPAGINSIRAAITSNLNPSYTLQVIYLWNNENQIRVDRWYKNFIRPSLFSTKNTNLTFNPTIFGRGTAANLHCTNVPEDLVRKCGLCDARLIHYGYIDRAMRVAKYDYYNTVDPDNILEDRYRHIVQGDIPEVPAHVVLKHAGPLVLEPYEVVNA